MRPVLVTCRKELTCWCLFFFDSCMNPSAFHTCQYFIRFPRIEVIICASPFALRSLAEVHVFVGDPGEQLVHLVPAHLLLVGIRCRSVRAHFVHVQPFHYFICFFLGYLPRSAGRLVFWIFYVLHTIPRHDPSDAEAFSSNVDGTPWLVVAFL